MLCDHLTWLTKFRKKYHHNDSFWDFKSKIKTNPKLLTSIQNQVDNASYNFSPARKVIKSNNEITTIWDASDSLVLKYLAEKIKANNKFSKYVYSNKGNGGIYKATRIVHKLIKSHKYIYRSDVKSFYNSINHQILIDKLAKFTTNNYTKLIAKHLKRIEWQNGQYIEIYQGISKSSALSPVLGCIYLHQLDKAMTKLDIKYLRYADDWIILAKTKPKLRKAVKVTKQILNKLQLKEHPDKTDYRNFNNPNTKNFDFLGIEISARGVINIKKQTRINFINKINRLYELIKCLTVQCNSFTGISTYGTLYIRYLIMLTKILLLNNIFKK